MPTDADARSDLLALTKDLVAIPSHEDETAAGDAVERWLRAETDAAVTRDDVGNVIARKGSGSPSLALIGHHDVVPPAERQTRGEGTDGEYVVERRDGRLYGRGAADMKGAVAAALCAFRDADPDRELVVASFVGEEVGGDGARAAIDDGFAPDRAIVAEGSTGYSAPGVTDVAIAHRGRRASTVRVEGESVHASRPETGDNAIYGACDAVETIRGLDAPTTTVQGETVDGSVAVTEIEGGTAWNVVPDGCDLTVDERTVPGGRVDLGAVESVPGATWIVDQDLPPMACDDGDFADAVLAAARAVQDGAPDRVVKPHATDAGWLAAAGVSCVVCGPAERGEAHTDDESVGIDVLDRCRRLYRRAAESSE